MTRTFQYKTEIGKAFRSAGCKPPRFLKKAKQSPMICSTVSFKILVIIGFNHFYLQLTWISQLDIIIYHLRIFNLLSISTLANIHIFRLIFQCPVTRFHFHPCPSLHIIGVKQPGKNILSTCNIKSTTATKSICGALII